jgi:MFS family permease
VSTLPGDHEWREGWRIVLGCALASGTGIVLLFFTFNLFVLSLAEELGVSRGEIGAIQALVVTAAPGAFLIGRAADLFGFKPVYLTCAGLVVAIELLLATFGSTLLHMGIGVALLGFFGVGSTAVVTTRPVSTHFDRYRGRALGLVATGVSIAALIVPLVLLPVLDQYGWRGGFVFLALVLAVIGMPAIALLVPANTARTAAVPKPEGKPDWRFLKDRDFVFMAGAIVVMGIATAGFVGQLSPMIQSEGLSAAIGALALSAFAAGQFIGRLGGGWLLDRFEPRLVAIILTIGPGMGFLLLLFSDGLAAAAVLGAGLIGLQQGAELDIFAFFVARRFPVARYGTIFGALHGISWIGNGIGIAGVGLLHDRTGNYDLGQAIGMAALLLGAVLIGFIRLSAPTPRLVT